MNKWIKPAIFLVFMILACSVLGRVLTRGETLSEYARHNPDVTYGASEHAKLPSPSPAGMLTAVSAGTPTASFAASPMASSVVMPMVSPIPSPIASPDVSPMTSPSSASEAGTLAAAESSDRVHYEDGFFYQPLTDEVVARITGISYPVSRTIAPALSLHAVNVVPDDETLAVAYNNLRYLSVLYYDFDGQVQTGELICNEGIAQDLVEIFYELYLNEYQIEKIRLIDEYGGDDTASMLDNNTSCFNYRVVDGTDNLSKHALGCAIDINPFYNPYVVFHKDGSGETYISPEGSEIYADRSLNFPYKIDENDLCCKLFKAHGFTWGGNWNSCKDYQHFQKVVQ